MNAPKTVEERIVEMTRDRLERGRKQYGPFTVQPTSRNMLVETLEECVDANVYIMKKLIELIDSGQ